MHFRSLYDVSYAAFTVSVLAGHAYQYLELYGSDPGWITFDSKLDDPQVPCSYCRMAPSLRSRHDFNTGWLQEPFLHSTSVCTSCPRWPTLLSGWMPALHGFHGLTVSSGMQVNVSTNSTISAGCSAPPLVIATTCDSGASIWSKHFSCCGPSSLPVTAC